MSQFRIQRKLTEGSTIRPKIPLPYPSRMRSLQSKRSFSRSPKQYDHESVKKIGQKISLRRASEESDVPRVRLQEGIKAYKQKNVAKAMQIFKQLYKNGLKSSQLTFYLGSCMLNTGKHQASIMYLNECLSLSKTYSPNAYLYIAINFKMIGNFKQAIKVLEEGLSLFPNFEEGTFYRGKLLMKGGEYSQAAEAFKSCLRVNPSNQLAILFLGDCFRHQGRREKAEDKYRKVLEKGQKYKDLASFRIASMVIQRQNYSDSYDILVGLLNKGIESPQLNFNLGLACWGLDKQQEAIVYYQSCLAATRDPKLASTTLKNILKMAIENCDFYEAEHQINRISKFNLQEQMFKEWKLFVEGVSDLVKRKNVNGCLKLQKALEIGLNRRLNRPECRQFLKFVYPYLGYALFITAKLQSAIEMYDKALEHDPKNLQLLSHRLSVEGIYLHSLAKYEEAVAKLEESFLHQKRTEALFMAAITLVRQFKSSPGLKQQICDSIENTLARACQFQTKNPLLLFYYSLFRLFLNKPCVQIIERAIQCCQEPISEYFFVYALALNSNQGRLKEAIDAISKAVDIDPGILQFYRQRSKYYFLQGEYYLAIQDCRKAEAMQPEDEQIHLLLSFYLYLIDEISQSYFYLGKINPSAGKLQQFQQALNLRLGKYQKLSQIGAILSAIRDQKEIEDQYILILQRFIAERYQYSEFSVYFYHLLLSVVQAVRKDYEKGLHHLFACLEEIQILIDQKQSQNVSFEVTSEQTESMLDEIKFNITVMSLLQGNFSETEKYIDIFTKQTSSEELRQTLSNILTTIKDQQYSGSIELCVQNQYQKISDQFPPFAIPIHKATLVTKLVVSYPVKLKFTIAPEFDPSYLLNFDIEKIEYKIPPPWLKSPERRLNFTDEICQQSIHLSESHLSQRSQMEESGSARRHMFQNLRLDSGVEAKLKKIIKK